MGQAPWIAVLVCVMLSATADAVSTKFWSSTDWRLGATIVVLGPLVFFAFGYAGNRFGLSIASCLTNSLIVIVPVLVGLFLFKEWKSMNAAVYVGMALIV